MKVGRTHKGVKMEEEILDIKRENYNFDKILNELRKELDLVIKS